MREKQVKKKKKKKKDTTGQTLKKKILVDRLQREVKKTVEKGEKN